MATPQRIRLSRAKGFRLQEVSLALNGLPVVKVDRSTDFGNPYSVSDREKSWQSAVVECFRVWLRDPTQEPLVGRIRAELRGKNLACWCALPKPGEPDICHAAVLLEIANAEPDS